MRLRLVPLLLLICPAGALPGAAQPAQSPPVNGGKDIVVTGHKLPPAKAVRQATARITAPAGAQGDQVARFTADICPQVQGLEDRYDAIVEQRMREDAAAARIGVAKAGCRPNVIVLAVDDGRAILAALSRSQPEMFGAMPDGAMKRLLKDDGPVHVMNLTDLRPADGPRVQALSDVAGLGKDVPTMQIREASIIKMATRQDISGSLVLIDKPAMLGKTLRQIADYAVMRGMAVTEAPRESLPTDSILTLFAATGTPPPDLTGFDRDYLRSLYWGPANQSYHMMVGQIAEHINRANRQPASAPRP